MERKKTLNIAFLFVCLFMLLLQYSAVSQNWTEDHKILAERNWLLNVNAGVSSYYGDLSVYDNNLPNKLTKESGPCLGLLITKQITPEFGISGQILGGQLFAKKENISIESTIYEYNINIRFNIFRMLSKASLTKLKWDVYTGVGNFVFYSKKIEYFEGDNKIIEHESRVPEFVYFVGSGISYRFNEYASIGIDYSVHQFQNDKIDITVKNDDFDYFSYLQVGFTYHLRSLQRTSIRNKARIAHNNKRLKHLNHKDSIRF